MMQKPEISRPRYAPSAPLTMTAQFIKRICPSCFASEPRPLFQVSPSQFIQPSYGSEQQQRFGIEPDRKFGIVRCGRCSFIYAEHIPTPAFAMLLYDTPEGKDIADPERHASLRPA